MQKLPSMGKMSLISPWSTQIWKPSYSTQTPNDDNKHSHSTQDKPPISSPWKNKIQNHSLPSLMNNNNSPQWKSNNYDVNKVSYTIVNSLPELGIDIGAKSMEVKVKYRTLLRIYHPNVHNLEETGMSHTKAQYFFQIINNARSFFTWKNVTVLFFVYFFCHFLFAFTWNIIL